MEGPSTLPQIGYIQLDFTPVPAATCAPPWCPRHQVEVEQEDAGKASNELGRYQNANVAAGQEPHDLPESEVEETRDQHEPCHKPGTAGNGPAQEVLANVDSVDLT